MANLTLDEKLVEGPSSPPQARPGRYLVVYARDRGGEEFHQLVEEGRAFRPGLRGMMMDFVGYSIAADSMREYHDTLHSQTEDQAYRCSVRYSLEYRVTQPRRLVEVLISDPLRRLRTAAEGLLDEAIRRLPWRVIHQGGGEFERTLIEPILLRLRSHADLLGFEVLGLRAVRILSEEDAKANAVMIRLDEDERLRDLETHKALQQLDREALIREREGQHDRRKRTADLAHSSFNDAMARSIADANSMGALKARLEELAPIAGFLGDRMLNPAPEPSPAAGAAPSAFRALMAEVGAFLTQLPHSTKTGFGPVMLRLLAEALAGPRADLERVDGLLDNLADQIRSQAQPLAPAQVELLQRFRDFEALQALVDED